MYILTDKEGEHPYEWLAEAEFAVMKWMRDSSKSVLRRESLTLEWIPPYGAESNRARRTPPVDEEVYACACHCSCCAPVEFDGDLCPMCADACGPLTEV